MNELNFRDAVKNVFRKSEKLSNDHFSEPYRFVAQESESLSALEFLKLPRVYYVFN